MADTFDRLNRVAAGWEAAAGRLRREASWRYGSERARLRQQTDLLTGCAEQVRVVLGEHLPPESGDAALVLRERGVL